MMKIFVNKIISKNTMMKIFVKKIISKYNDIYDVY